MDVVRFILPVGEGKLPDFLMERIDKGNRIPQVGDTLFLDEDGMVPARVIAVREEPMPAGLLALPGLITDVERGAPLYTALLANPGIKDVERLEDFLFSRIPQSEEEVSEAIGDMVERWIQEL
jgi:hypothetical protein